MALSRKLVLGLGGRVEVGGLRLYLDHFHTPPLSQKEVLKLSYCLRSLKGTLRTYDYRISRTNKHPQL